MTSACTSASSGRRPSIVTATQVPATCWAWCSTKSPVGSVTAAMPSEDRSKQPTSSTGPNRFFIARSIRKRELRSPSKCSTTSTRCSSTRGPAIEPSLVTWPTSTVVMLRVLATRISAAATSLTWVTPPGTPSMPDGADGLDGVDHQQRRADLLDVGEHGAEVGLGGEVELVVHAAGAVGAQPDLGGGLLAGDVERAVLMRAVCAATSSSSVLLPTPGSPASRIAAPGTRPPPSTRSSSGTPLVRDVDSLDRDLRRSGRPGSSPGRRPPAASGQPTSATDPQAWHSPQRPTHLPVSQPHSAQR